MLWRRVLFAGALAAGRCTSIRLCRFPEASCKLSREIGVAEVLVRGVLFPLAMEGVAEVKTVDESDATLDALCRPASRFTEGIASSCGGAAVISSAAAELLVLTMVFQAPSRGDSL